MELQGYCNFYFFTKVEVVSGQCMKEVIISKKSSRGQWLIEDFFGSVSLSFSYFRQ